MMNPRFCSVRRLVLLAFSLLLLLPRPGIAQETKKEIPAALAPWADWATWDDEHRHCPTPYSDEKKHFCVWSSRMGLQVTKTGALFDFSVTAFHDAWMTLPGNADAWPLNVRLNGAPVPVLEQDGRPAVKLPKGTHRLEGAFQWNDYPQRLQLPQEIGILALVIEEKPVERPVWDAQSFLWLRRDGSTEETDKDYLATKIYAALEDGIPLWWRTEIELTVSGKSREEDLGIILPEGWKLASVESQIPVAVDDTGKMKAQVRAGKWTIQAAAFRIDNPKEIRYAAGVKPAVEEQLVAFRSKPDFRMVEITGIPSIDVSQTTFPEKWRELPVYRWDTNAAFKLEERMRGMGDQKPAGLTIAREWWLDEKGEGLTFRDRITGQMQHIWRLDAAEGQDLGSVRAAGQGQLITKNPQTAAPGVEVRTRSINLEATGRMNRTPDLAATGWRSDADSVQVTLNLPPGWRLFALFGADWVRGDWLTAWTLLDLFLLLVFSLAVFRLWGWAAGILAFLAFALAYHEPGAPRLVWFCLLIPLALHRYIPEGWAKTVVGVVKWFAIVLFVLFFVPFLAAQVQQALYPQLESVRVDQLFQRELGTQGIPEPAADYSALNDNGAVSDVRIAPNSAPVAVQERQEYQEFDLTGGILSRSSKASKNWKGDNLNYDAKARIQTGPGVPEWKWREVSFGWNGPVQEAQKVTPVLISQPMQRVMTVLRVVLLLALATVLLDARRLSAPIFRGGAKAATCLLFFVLLGSSAFAQSGPIPDADTLKTLRDRLLAVPDAYPHAADIPVAKLKIAEGKLTLEAEVHAAIRTAVPLPGSLPAWSPLTLTVDDKPEVAMRRQDGYLWIVVEPGVHRVKLEGLLANATEWEWTYLLKPRRVEIEAPDWTFSGVRADGVPEAQVFFAIKQKAAPGQASYDRQDFQTIAVIDRHLELGLLWQIRTTVTRLSPLGKAVALRVPLLPGENVLSSNAVVREGFIEVRLGAQEQGVTWESNLAIAPQLQLAARQEDTWVERWHLVASPIWNVTLAGLPPIFEQGKNELIPVWQPWPGESVQLTISRPEAVAGATITVSRGTHAITLGRRQRVSQLDLTLRCSLGEDFLVGLPPEAEITSLTHNSKAIPVRKDGARLVIPLRPGEQTISIGWKINTPLDFKATAEEVRLPVESANISTSITVPQDRWVLGADGPLRGPAVRFWGILLCALIAAVVLARIAFSPLRIWEWMLLGIGLTQVPLPAALIVVGWLFLLAWRGDASFQRLLDGYYNTLQVLLILLTVVGLGILVFAVGEGLLGNPEMFIRGNFSTTTVLKWFQARTVDVLPQPSVYSISIWWYRFLMLAWALWLAAALIRWLRVGWGNFNQGGCFRNAAKPEMKPQPFGANKPAPAPAAASEIQRAREAAAPPAPPETKPPTPPSGGPPPLPPVG